AAPSVAAAIPTVLATANAMLGLRSASLVERRGDQVAMTVWRGSPRPDLAIDEATDHARQVYRHLAETPDVAVSRTEIILQGVFPEAESEPLRTYLFLVLPLVVQRNHLLGLLQLEVSPATDPNRFPFAFAVARNVAEALDREQERRRDTSQREAMAA